MSVCVLWGAERRKMRALTVDGGRFDRREEETRREAAEGMNGD